MVKVTVYKHKSSDNIIGFECEGHADYADDNDIVCAAVSVLVINTVNSIEELTDADYEYDEAPDGGVIKFKCTGGADTDRASAGLLLRSMVLGLLSIQKEYKGHIQVIYRDI